MDATRRPESDALLKPSANDEFGVQNTEYLSVTVVLTATGVDQIRSDQAAQNREETSVEARHHQHQQVTTARIERGILMSREFDDAELSEQAEIAR